MPYFHLLTFGCKVNQVDSRGLAQALTELGWQAAPPGVAPDAALVNTCTVTARADQQARQAVRRLGREYPGASIWVTGCYAQRAPAEVAALPGVAGVVGNREKGWLAQYLARPPQEPRPLVQVGSFGTESPFQVWPLHPFPGQTRARLKVQEGCSRHCSYCIVPQVRGPGRSMAPAAVAAAWEELAARGYQEVVLTGVDLGQYGRDLDPPQTLAALLRDFAARPRPFRLRLSSLEPQDLTADLPAVLAACPGLCPHFHLPLQSGAAPVLAAMQRPYGPEDFRERFLALHGLFPDAALGLDVLVGFPGESAGDFQATYDLVHSLPVAYLHVFPFSPRPGTPAAQMTPCPAPEIKGRGKIMRDLGRQQKLQFYQAHLGQVGEVLVEGPAPQPGHLQGLSANYLRVVLPGPPEWRNRRLMVRYRQMPGEYLVGEVVGQAG